MSLLDAILNAQGGAAVQQLSAQFGLGSDQTTQALSALVPAIAAGVHQNTQISGGLAGLVEALASGQHQQYVNDPSTLGQPSTTADGNGILGHIFGSKDVSREVAAQAAAHTGISADVLKQMLPVVAALAMGALARHNAGGGSSTAAPGSMGGLGAQLGLPSSLGGGSDLVSILTSTLSQASGSGSGAGGMIAGMLGRLMGR